MRDMLGRLTYLAVTVSAIAVVWVAAKHPPEPQPTYISPDGKVHDGPPAGSPYSKDTNGREEILLRLDGDRPTLEGPVAAAAPR